MDGTGANRPITKAQASPAADPPGPAPETKPAPEPEAEPKAEAEPEAIPEPDVQPEPEPKPEPVPADDPLAGRERLVAFFNIGNSSQVVEDRMVGRGIKRSGWDGLVRLQVRPLLKWGVRRVELHNPFGDHPDQHMRLDQYQLAQEAGLNWLTEGFVEAWQPVVRGDYTEGQPVEVIAYVGNTYGYTFGGLHDAGDLAGFRSRAETSVKPFLDAGMSIGFDSASLAEADDPFYHFIRDLRDAGTRVYIEPWPRREMPHWFSFNIITAEAYYQNSQTHPVAGPRDQLSGEIIRLQAHKPEEESWAQPDWIIPDIIDALGDEDTVAAHIGAIRNRITLERLLRESRNSHRAETASYD